MGELTIDRFHLKANASFCIREGWLTKGLLNVQKDAAVFTNEEAAIRKLGIGSAMVKSLRNWMQISGLTVEQKTGKRMQYLTEVGKLISERDPYFEDPFSLCYIHYHIVTNKELATVWFLLFNYSDMVRFTKAEMYEELIGQFKQMTDKEFSPKSFEDDCSTALKTYASDDVKQLSPEDNMQCPLVSLSLFTKTAKGYYEKTVPPADMLPASAIHYVIMENANGQEGVSMEKLLSEPCNVGRVFHLTPYRLNVYLDELQSMGALEIQRTAGLNMIYPGKKSSYEIAKDYYYGRNMNNE